MELWVRIILSVRKNIVTIFWVGVTTVVTIIFSTLSLFFYSFNQLKEVDKNQAIIAKTIESYNSGKEDFVRRIEKIEAKFEEQIKSVLLPMKLIQEQMRGEIESVKSDTSIIRAAQLRTKIDYIDTLNRLGLDARTGYIVIFYGANNVPALMPMNSRYREILEIRGHEAAEIATNIWAYPLPDEVRQIVESPLAFPRPKPSL